MELTTGRCMVRPFTEADIEDFMAYRNDESWMRYQGFKGLDRAAYMAALLAAPSPGKGVQYAIAERAGQRLIGDLYLRQAGDACWVGYTISPGWARQGYAFEVLSALIPWARGAGVYGTDGRGTARQRRLTCAAGKAGLPLHRQFTGGRVGLCSRAIGGFSHALFPQAKTLHRHFTQ